jgi:hypothetical protein
MAWLLKIQQINHNFILNVPLRHILGMGSCTHKMNRESICCGRDKGKLGRHWVDRIRSILKIELF